MLGQALELLASVEAGAADRSRRMSRRAQRLQRAQLLTAKPVLYVCNVDEGDAADGNAYRARVFDKAAGGRRAARSSSPRRSRRRSRPCPAEERDAFLSDLGLHETGLDRVIRAGYELLGLITFFTAGPEGSARLDGAQGRQGAARRPA